MKEIITIIMSLAGVIFLIFLTYYAANWLNKRVRFSGNTTVKVVEKINLGPDRAIMIISIGEKYMLIGVTSQHIEKISDLDKTDMEKIMADKIQKTPQPFAMTLFNAITAKKQSKGGDNNDKE